MTADPGPDHWRPAEPLAPPHLPVAPSPPVAPTPPAGTHAPAVPPAPAVPVPGSTPSAGGVGAGLSAEPRTDPLGLPASVIGRGRPDRPAIGWTEIAVAAVVYLVVQILGGGLLLLADGGALPGAPVLVGLSAVAAFLAVGVAISVRVRSLAALGMRRVRLRVIALAFGVGVGTWVLSRVLVIVYTVLTRDTSDPQRDLTTFSGGVAAALVVVIGGVVVPCGEELLFRGVGFGGLHRYGVWVAALVSGLVFAAAHGFNAVFAAAGLLGVVNAVLYQRTRSIWPAVTAHATFNLLSFGLLLAVGGAGR